MGALVFMEIVFGLAEHISPLGMMTTETEDLLHTYVRQSSGKITSTFNEKDREA